MYKLIFLCVIKDQYIFIYISYINYVFYKIVLLHGMNVFLFQSFLSTKKLKKKKSLQRKDKLE